MVLQVSGSRAVYALTVAAAALVAPPAWAGLASAGEAIHLIPHRAVYDLTLDQGEDAGLLALTGRIVFESVGSSCEGFTETLRFVTRSQDSDGDTIVTDLQSSTFELGDNFDFIQRTLFNGEQLEDIRGRATRSGASIQVALQRPEEKALELPVAAVFPSEHMRLVIAAALRGENFVQVEVFDGSDNGETVTPVTTVIGAQKDPAADAGEPDRDAVAAVGAIASHRAWPVVFSYFEAGARMEEAAPGYQMSGLLYDNGIIRKLHFDYGDYSINGALSEIKFFDVKKCPSQE